MEITAKSWLVSAKGGEIDAQSPDGEVLFSVSVPAGKVRAADYLDLLPDGAYFVAAKGLAVVNPQSGMMRQPYGQGEHESGANPDFQPTSADLFQRQMRLQMAQLQARSRKLEARQRALDAVERDRMTAKPPEGDLIEAAEGDKPEGGDDKQ